MHAMIAVWLLFTVVLFVAEPLILHRWLLARAKVKPEATFRFLEWLHWVWLILVWSLLSGAGQPWSAAVLCRYSDRGIASEDLNPDVVRH